MVAETKKKIAAKIWKKLKAELDSMGGNWDYFVQDLEEECEEARFYKRMRDIIEKVLNENELLQ